MNKKRIFQIIAATMTVASIGGLGELGLARAVELIKSAESKNEDSKAKVEVTTGQAVKVLVDSQEDNEDKSSNVGEDVVKENAQIDENNEKETTGAAVEAMTWTFDNDDEGWKYGGDWSYSGTKEVSYDENLKALKLGVDYSKNSDDSWSEFKIQKDFEDEKNFKDYDLLTFDFIFNPDSYNKGTFKTKLFVTNDISVDTSIDLSKAEDFDNGLKKVKVSIGFTKKDIKAKSVTLSIVGNSTDYKGNIYIDNIKFGQDESKTQYTLKTEVPKKQDKVSVTQIEKYMPKTVKLVDGDATPATADLYAYLAGIGRSGKVIYGHQNDTHWKAMYRNGGSESDTKDITGSIAGITGIDVLSLTGHEINLSDEEMKGKGTDYFIDKAVEIGKSAYTQGAITTLSQHMPNFAEVLKKGKGADGKYDYSGYSANDTSGNVVDRMMPGGDLNEVYNGYLDLVVEYAHKMKDKDGNPIPIIYRPYHENNGGWFWWGAPFCDTQSFKNLFAYTVHYIRDENDVHNFLYAYSPNGPFEDEADYLSRYPGDEYVDILAFDMYHDDPLDPAVDQWMNTLKETVDIVDGIVKKKGKLSAVSETGIRKNGWGMPLNSTPDLNWYTHVTDILKKSNMSYLMTWSNFNNTDNYYAPYMADETTGHELINDLIRFYNDKDGLFADRIGDYTKADAKIDGAYSSGYISEPISRSRILKPTKIAGCVENADGEVKFNIKNKNNELIESIPAKKENNQWTAEITQELLDKIGVTTGAIELCAGDKVINHINAIFNIKEAVKNPIVVDDFESYLGDSDLIKSEWAKNAGAGCNAAANLSTEHKNNGSYGLAFDYSISTAKVSEGWAGITKPLEADWTGYDALQLWCTPDGKGQKLVIQITSNGEDFEVYLPEFAATTEPKLLKIPFSDFKGKNGGKLDLSKITKMGIWCNTIVPEGREGSWTVNSTMYFDDIKAVKLNESSSSSHSSHHSSSHHSSSSDDDNSSTNIDNNESEEGWVSKDGKWYYIQNSVKKTGWFKDTNGEWYYFDADGVMQTGWFKDNDGIWYYLESNGAMKTGWFRDVNGAWYYLNTVSNGYLGAMKTGWFKDTNGTWYYLDSNGAMLTDTVIDGYVINSAGAWI